MSERANCILGGRTWPCPTLGTGTDTGRGPSSHSFSQKHLSYVPGSVGGDGCSGTRTGWASAERLCPSGQDRQQGGRQHVEHIGCDCRAGPACWGLYLRGGPFRPSLGARVGHWGLGQRVGTEGIRATGRAVAGSEPVRASRGGFGASPGGATPDPRSLSAQGRGLRSAGGSEEGAAHTPCGLATLSLYRMCGLEGGAAHIFVKSSRPFQQFCFQGLCC